MAALLGIIAPVFLLILLGYGLGHTRLFGERDAKVLINFVWYVAIPALLFRALAPQDLPDPAELIVVAAYYLSLYTVYGLALVAARLFGQTPEERPVTAFVVCFGNGAFLGIPLMEAAYGEEGVRVLLIILSFHTLTLLPVSTLLVQRAQGAAEGAAGGTGGVLKKTFDQVRQNPIIVSLFVGLGWAAADLPFPYWLDRITALPAGAAAPAGLFAAGLSMTGVRVAGDLKQSLTMVTLKLIALPSLVYTVSHFVFALPSLWVGTATLAAALPSGMVAYSFATQYNIAPRRAASAVLLSTGTAIFTLSALLILLGVQG